MRGQVLDFDFRSGDGLIAGDDGQRYRFTVSEWKPKSPPRRGISVDFETFGTLAMAIYPAAGVVHGEPGRRASSGGATSDKNKIAAALLALVLGSLGVHKFYLNKPGAGMVMLLCSVFGFILLFIPTIVIGLIAFIEFIIYLTLSDAEFERRYVYGNQSWF